LLCARMLTRMQAYNAINFGRHGNQSLTYCLFAVAQRTYMLVFMLNCMM